LTNETAIINVYTRERGFPETLSIKTANQVVKFKNGHRRFFTDTTNILWVDSTHYKVFVRPHTTIDFEDITGHFFSSSPYSDIQVFVTSKQTTDTLMNGDFREDKFHYKQNGFIPPQPLWYYDIKDR